MNIDFIDIALLALAAVAVAYLPTVRAYLNARKQALIDLAVRHDLMVHIVHARRIFEDNEQSIAYALEQIERRYPELDAVELRTQIAAVLAWVEENLDPELYIRGTQGGMNG